MYPDGEAALHQVARGYQTVAAVIAGAAEHPGLACVRCHRAGQLGDCQAGALHQAGVLGLAERLLFNQLAALRIPQRLGCGVKPVNTLQHGFS